MRKLLSLIAVTLIAAASASAETHYKPHMSIGGRAGVTMSRISFSPGVPQKMALGSTATLTFRYTEEKLFGVIGEIGWAQRGWREDFEESPLSYRRTTNYATLGVMTQIIFGSRRFKCFVNLGPEIAYLLGSSISADFDYNNPLDDPAFPTLSRMTEQMSDEIKNKFDYGIAGGIGCEFYVQPRHSVTVEARYYFGLGNIFPASKADTFGASRNTTIEVTVGYNFRLQ